VFVELDEDGNGLLSRDELCAGLVSFGLAKASPMASGSPKHALDASRARLSCYFVTISKEIVSELHSSMSTTSSQDTDRSGESEPEPRDTLPLNELFAAVDIDPRHADALTFEEFVVLMAIIALLRVKEVREPSGAGVHVAEDDLADFEAAADIVLDCFISFDADSDGLVSREEIAHVLAGHSTPTSMRRHSDDRDQMHDVVLRRFEEMDVDDSGNVSFPEFLLAIQQWAADAGEPDLDSASPSSAAPSKSSSQSASKSSSAASVTKLSSASLDRHIHPSPRPSKAASPGTSVGAI
jgi:hypothetical protein